MTSSTVTTIVRAVSSSSGSVVINKLQTGRSEITTAGTYIPLNGSAIDYILLYRCYNSSDDLVGVDFSTLTAGGFTATPLEDATLEWTALPI